MARLAREKFPQGKVGDTVKVRVPDGDRERCKMWFKKYLRDNNGGCTGQEPRMVY